MNPLDQTRILQKLGESYYKHMKLASIAEKACDAVDYMKENKIFETLDAVRNTK